MNAVAFILAINLVIAGLLAAAFMIIAAFDRQGTASRWFALSYLLGAGYILCEFLTPLAAEEPIPQAFALSVTFAMFFAATGAFNVALARNYDVSVPRGMMAAAGALGVVAVFAAKASEQATLVRGLAFQIPYVVMLLAGAWLILRSRVRRGRLDLLLAAVLAGTAAQFMSKPFLAMALGGAPASVSYLASPYAMISQALGSMFAMAVALVTLVILLRDLLAEANERSETDAISRLLNRGGFEARAAEALEAAGRRGLPVSLIIADLDHFKAVNDTYGHATGDRVIAAFASFLRAATTKRHLAGRIGGEEFAVLLPGANLLAAKLFAEGVRTGFSAGGSEVPLGIRVSASFGVAEAGAGETMRELLARADAALYAAKNDGRDCVRASPPPARLRLVHDARPLRA